MASAPISTSNLLELKPMRVMCDALEENRLSHSIILSGEDFPLLEAACFFLAERILADPQAEAAQPALENHPDFLPLRPANKMRQISAGNTRDLIRGIHHSPRVSRRKVAVVYEAERMHPSAANIFLKTLEEPPSNTTIILLTSRPGFLLPTIRSRCLNFRLPRTGALQSLPPPAEAWLESYSEWLQSLPDANLRDKAAITARILSLYGLLAQVSAMLKVMVAETREEQKEKQTAHLTEEEIAALEEGIKTGIRDRLFASIERRTRDFARELFANRTVDSSRVVSALGAAIAELERSGRLLRVNLNETAALESFFLASLRLWTRLRSS